MRAGLRCVMFAVTLCAASTALCQGLEGAATAEERGALAQRLQSRWPTQGAIHLRYANENRRNHLEVGFDFSTGAWYRLWQYEMVTGVTPDGAAYNGHATISQPDTGESLQGVSWLLDSVVPQLGLVEILNDGRWPVRIEDVDGVLRVTAMLPRGSRMPIESLSAAEIDRWGGREGMLREVSYLLRADLTVASRSRPTYHDIRDPRTKIEEFDIATESPDGFQVVRTHPPPGEMVLIECSMDPIGSSRAFDADSVVARAIARRREDPQVTPVVTAEQADADPQRPTPVSGSPAGWPAGAGLVAGGVVLVLLAAGAWWRAKRA